MLPVRRTDSCARVGIEVFDAGAAIGGDDAGLDGVGLEQARDEVASARFEKRRMRTSSLETLLGIGTVVGFEDAAIEG